MVFVLALFVVVLLAVPPKTPMGLLGRVLYGLYQVYCIRVFRVLTVSRNYEASLVVD